MWKIGRNKEFLKGNTWETGHWKCLGINGSVVLTWILRKQVLRLEFTDIFLIMQSYVYCGVSPFESLTERRLPK
jgi:hypothetical protein